MISMKSDQNIRPSVLNRLLDYDTSSHQEPVQNHFYNIRQLEAAVIRDIENLFNTRKQITPVPELFSEVRKSLFTYGLDDFTSENPKSLPVKHRLRQAVENALKIFEPRLKNVIVRIDNDSTHERNLRFRISAVLMVEPETEPVSFDTYFDSNRGEYIIQNRH